MHHEHLRCARRIERRVARFVEQRSLVRGGERVLLAVSGGPDSLALLHIIAHLRGRLSVEPIAAYIDHGIRPAADVDAERAFVESEARGLGVAFVAATSAASTAVRRAPSPEDAARRGRYTALAALAEETDAPAVATGHTRSDQAETVLLRMLGGSGLRGLAAMAASAGWPVPEATQPRLVRPLLCLSRQETVAYCSALMLSPRSDPENRNPRYLRNRVRSDVLPVLTSLNPQIESVLADLAEEAQHWRTAAETDVPLAERRDGAGGCDLVMLDVAKLRAMQPPARLIMLRAALVQVLPPGARAGRAHLVALDRLARDPRGRSASLPAGGWAWREAGALLIAPAKPPVPPKLEADRAVPVPGSLDLPGWRIDGDLIEEAADVPATAWEQPVRLDAASDLVVGPRRPGDRIELAGMSGRRRLQDLFVDAGIPRHLRDSWPVLRSANGIVWVPGVSRVAAWAAVRTGPAVWLRVRQVGHSEV